MHRTVAYAGNRRKAMLDFAEWCGFRRTRKLFQTARHCSRENFEHWCAFAGVQGFPVHVVYDKYGRDK